MKNIVLCLWICSLCACNHTSKKERLPLVPYPAYLVEQDGSFNLNPATSITYTDLALKEAMYYFQRELKKSTGMQLEVKQSEAVKAGIEFRMDTLLSRTDKYEMKVTPQGITVVVANPRSAILAIQTLRQLLPMDGKEKEVNIPALTVADEPLWAWRGMMLDVSSFFQ